MKTMKRGLGIILLAWAGQAATNVWDGGGADNNWSTGANWNPDGDVPVSASNTWIKLDGIIRTTPVQNIAAPLLLNRLDFLNGPSAGGKAAFSVSGSQLQFVSNGVAPRIFLDRWATCSVGNAIEIPADTMLIMEIGTYGVSFNGAISGAGGIDKLQNAGGIDLNSPNSFSGGLTIRATGGDWSKVNIRASSGMGTGPVSLYGGSLATGLTSPGGLSFYGTTTQTNSISLFQNSPIFAGMPNGGDVVTLNGPIDLNSNTLYLRGGGSGTIGGGISEGGASAVTKVDKGTWTLSGANTFTGRLTLVNGTVKLGASGALSPLVPVTFACATGWYSVATATLDLNGYNQTVSQLSGSISQAGLTNVVTSAAPASLTVNQSTTSLFDGRLTGALSLIKAGTGTLTLSNSLSAITGSMTVSNGTLIASLATSLGNSTNVTVAGGTLDLRAAAIADTATLSIATGSKVAVASGLVEFVDKLCLDGVQQTSGTYGAAGSGAQHESAFFDGSGMVLVLSNPPITPVDATWDAEGADLNFSTAANWSGDTLPAFDGTTRALFASGGATASVDTAVNFYGIAFSANTNFAVDAGAGEVRLGTGGVFAQVPSATARSYAITEDVVLGAHQIWNVTNNGAGATTLTVAGAVSDGLAVYNLTKAGTGILVLSGNNTYDGVTTVKTGGVVRITSGTAFGSAVGSTTVEDGGIVEMSGGITVTESFALYGDASTSHQGVLRSNGGSNVLSGRVLNGSRIRCNSGSLDIVGGATGGQFVLAASGGTFIRVSEKPISIGGATFFAHSDALTILDVTNNVWSQLEVSGNILRTDQENALPPTSILTLGPSAFGGVNLNGKNQTIGSLVCAYTTPGTRIVYSTTPATLTVTQNVSSTFNGAITGAVTVVKMGTGALTLSNTNTLYGTVAVSNGTLAVSSTGTLGANCTNIVVASGTLALSNSVAIANGAALSIATNVSAKVSLAPGVNEAVGHLYIGGAMQRVGTYGSTASSAQVRDDTHFAGTGILTVLHDNSGTMISVR